MKAIAATLIAFLAASAANAQWIDFSFVNRGFAIMTEAITPNVSEPNEAEKYAVRLSFVCTRRNKLVGYILPRTGTRFHARLRYADIDEITGRTHVNRARVWKAKQEEDEIRFYPLLTEYRAIWGATSFYISLPTDEGPLVYDIGTEGVREAITKACAHTNLNR